MTNTLVAAAPAKTADTGAIRFGAAFRLLPAAKTADSGAIRFGAAFRLLPVGRKQG